MFIRSSKTSSKFANEGKLITINSVIDEYKRVMSNFVDILWGMEKIPSLLPKEITDQVDTFLSARAIQCCGKQASGVVRGTRQKQKQRLFVIQRLIKENNLKAARRLQKKYDSVKTTKPNINSVEMELDSRFVEVDFDTETSFSGYITISSLGNRSNMIGKIEIPFRSTRHLEKLRNKGKMTNGIRLSKKNITFMFELEPEENTGAGEIGIDKGLKKMLSCDMDGVQFQTGKDVYGHDLYSINDKVCRRKKGSKGFRRAQAHRTNYINHEINGLPWKQFGKLYREQIKYMRYKQRTSRQLSHWVYREIDDKSDLNAEQFGVQIVEVNPTYTSQRCSRCGWTRKTNRKGELFRCGVCGFETNADLNAATNIRLNLHPIGKKERQLQKNRDGFYWNVIGEEPIVPHVQETDDLISVISQDVIKVYIFSNYSERRDIILLDDGTRKQVEELIGYVHLDK